MSIQKLYSLQRQDINVFIRLIDILALSSVLGRRHQFVSILNAHLILILTCEW